MTIKLQSVKYKIATGLLIASFLAPAVAFAMPGNSGDSVSGSADINTSSPTEGIMKPGSDIKTGSDANFCTNLPAFTVKVNARIAADQASLTAKEQAMTSSLQERQTKRAQQLADARAKQDQTRTAIYAKLTAKATTDAEKQAVITFKTSVDAAVAVRRSAVDAAILAYWTGVNSTVAGRQSAVQTARQNFVTAMTAALATASSQCAAGTASATVRLNFGTSANAARTKLASDRKAIDKAGPQIKALAQTRNTAVKAAWATFGKALEQAGTLLRAAFPAATSDSGSLDAKVKANYDVKSLKK